MVGRQEAGKPVTIFFTSSKRCVSILWVGKFRRESQKLVLIQIKLIEGIYCATLEQLQIEIYLWMSALTLFKLIEKFDENEKRQDNLEVAEEKHNNVCSVDINTK